MVTNFYLAGASIALSWFSVCFALAGELNNAFAAGGVAFMLVGLAVMRNYLGCKD